MALVVVSFLAGCTSAPTADASRVAAEVARTVERHVDVRPGVDCGTERLGIADGAVIDCTITDPGSDHMYDARTVIINPDGDDRFTVNLSVANDPKP